MIQPTTDFCPPGNGVRTPSSVGPASSLSTSRPGQNFEPPDVATVWTLVEQARSGNADAQTQLVARYRRRVAGMARCLVRGHHAVEDITQTVFIKMFRHLDYLRDASTFDSWILTITRNTAVDYIRRARRRLDSVPLDVEHDRVSDAQKPGAMDEILTALDEALARLAPVDRRMMRAYVAGESYRTIAEQNGCSIGSVKLRLHRMRPYLRNSVGAMTGTRGTDGRWSVN